MPMVHEDQDRHKGFTRRILMLSCGKAALLSALVGRMYYLQVIEAEKYKTLAEDNRVNLRLLPPRRGNILDRFGVEVANNQQNFRVVVVKEQTPDLMATLDALAKLIKLSEHDYKRILRDVKRKRGFVPVTVKDNLSWDQVSSIEVNSADLPGASIEVGETRFYPYGADMSHILGYVAAVSEKELTGDPLLELPGFRIGKSGIEKYHDNDMRGQAGTSEFEVNAYGRVIRELARNEGGSGREMILTVDAGLQTFVQQRLMSELSAASVVIDIQNGDVLAMGSVPGYDPSAFNLGLSSKQWNGLINNPYTPLSNKAISGTYAPGSTFKMIVALAAMKEGIGALSHTAYCPGFMKLGNARFHCWKRGGHGNVNMIEGLQHSCDVYFYDVARRIGVDKIAEMANKFGLGEKVGIDLPGERSGVIPTKAWKEANIGEPWQGGETLVTSIGQGFVLATPLQLGVMVARIAAGGKKVIPRLARGYREGEKTVAYPVPEFEDLGIPSEHMKMIFQGMDAVSNNPRGTAYKYRIKDEGWELAGKTGTAQVRRITLAERQAGVFKNEDLPWRRRDHGLFVAYAPVDNPRYACAVVVEHGSGSKSAAPIARDILRETQRRDPANTPAVPLQHTAEATNTADEV
ncbi:penicillin-binding protein 2 [uncultured Kiloniella sp.]|uniref:penicillin-binding protein 2 n=1 Tax=uncultured Kiloniella sp. TaxID=1133091 RepID=UPI0026239028|nr:penicillin-binding protein 2 [uncultured Kiloniella sp.]